MRLTADLRSTTGAEKSAVTSLIDDTQSEEVVCGWNVERSSDRLASFYFFMLKIEIVFDFRFYTVF